MINTQKSVYSKINGTPFVANFDDTCFSSVSSGLNAIAAVMLEDFCKPSCCKDITDNTATLLSRGFGKNIVFIFLNSKKRQCKYY